MEGGSANEFLRRLRETERRVQRKLAELQEFERENRDVEERYLGAERRIDETAEQIRLETRELLELQTELVLKVEVELKAVERARDATREEASRLTGVKREVEVRTTDLKRRFEETLSARREENDRGAVLRKVADATEKLEAWLREAAKERDAAVAEGKAFVDALRGRDDLLLCLGKAGTFYDLLVEKIEENRAANKKVASVWKEKAELTRELTEVERKRTALKRHHQ